ncbi:hypothetical protein GW17_00003167 [Ensete ventricosum]|nr:hypothetical protein GW17_00003167 [Ensete ventricosum]RZR85620.1 hypothetical protein BHM03_00012638 [Ensete ventricosum]
MRVTSLLQDLTGHQSPVTEGVVHWSTTALALTRRLLPTVRGYCSSVGTSPVASCHGVEGAGLVRRLYCAARWQGGRLLRHKVVRGYPKFRSVGRRWDDMGET